MNIVIWNGGLTAGKRVALARQSLPPIVWNGKLNPKLDDSRQWGETLGNVDPRLAHRRRHRPSRQPHVRRRRRPDRRDASREILKHAGAVRAMQFDINPYWHTLITYATSGGLHPTLVVPQRTHRDSLPLARRPRLLRRLPAPARELHGSVQVDGVPARRAPSAGPARVLPSAVLLTRRFPSSGAEAQCATPRRQEALRRVRVPHRPPPHEYDGDGICNGESADPDETPEPRPRNCLRHEDESSAAHDQRCEQGHGDEGTTHTSERTHLGVIARVTFPRTGPSEWRLS